MCTTAVGFLFVLHFLFGLLFRLFFALARLEVLTTLNFIFTGKKFEFKVTGAFKF
jgi:hypothetical protein